MGVQCQNNGCNNTLVSHEKIDYLLLFLFSLEIILMVSDYKVICNKVSAVLSIMLLFVCIFCRRYRIKKLERYLILSIIVFLIYYFYNALFLSEKQMSAIGLDLLYYLIEFTPIFLLPVFTCENKQKTVRIIIKVFLFIWLVFCIISLIYFIKYYDIARLMAAYRDQYYSYAIGGGYPMAYGCCILSVYFFEIMLTKDYPKKLYPITIVGIILMSAVVFNANSFIVVIAELIGFLMILILNKVNIRYRKIVIVVLSIVSVLFIIALGKELLEFLLENTTNDMLRNRLEELYDFFVLGLNNYHVDLRFSLYKNSIDDFLKAPIFGIGYSSGDHSTLLDGLAQFGIIGCIPYFFIFLFPYYYARKNKHVSIYLVSFYLLLLLNPVISAYHLILIVYFIIPLINSDYMRRRIVNTV